MVEDRVHQPRADPRQHHPLVVEARHQHVDALALMAQHVLEGDLHVLEDQLGRVRAAHPELVEMRAGREARHGLLDQEGGDPLGPRLRVGAGVDHQRVGVGAVGDPVLRAVEHVAVVPLLRAQPHGDDVRPRPRLGHRQRADMLAAHQLGQVARLLLGGAVELDLVDAEVGMRPVAQRHAGRGARDLLHRDDMGEIAHPGPAVFLRHGDPEQAEVPHLAPQMGGEDVVAVDPGRERGDALLRPGLDQVAQRVEILAQGEVQAGGEHRRFLPGQAFAVN